MKLNLNFRDSAIRRISQHEFEFVFDLNNMNKPRLSQDARVYIEQFNVPEFLDEALGPVDGDLKGYFELRCNNIVNDGYDSELGNRGGSIIFTAPLENYRSFVNNNPMFINNFKINQNFLDDRLVFNLKVYDRFGDPYDTSYQYASEIDKDHATYTDYETAIKAYNVLNDENDVITARIKTLEQNIKTYEYSKTYTYQQYQDLHTDLMKELKAYTDDPANLDVRGKIIAEWLQIFLAKESLNSFLSFFEHQKIKRSTSPYTDGNIKPLFDIYYETYITYVDTEKNLEKLVTEKDELTAYSGENVLVDYVATFSNSENLSADSKNVNYSITDTTTSPATVTHEGSVNISYYNAKSFNKQVIHFKDLIQTTGDLAKGDVLVIDNTNFETSNPSEFTYYFAKDKDNTEKWFSLTSATGAPINVSNNRRFAVEVTKNGSTYNVTFLENRLESKGFDDPVTDATTGATTKDTITIKGEYLGGATPANNLVISIDTTDTIPPAEDILLEKYENPADASKQQGTIDIEITKPNNASTKTDEAYTIKSFDYSLSEKYSRGNTIRIPGDLLKGDTPNNDAILTVTSIYEDVTHTITESTNGATFSIPPTKIDQDTPNVIIRDDTATELNGGARPSAFGFIITSQNDAYSISLDPDITSVGFSANYQVEIPGQALTGITGTNDCVFNITTVLGSEILEAGITIDATNQEARLPEFNSADGFSIDIIQKLKSDVYEIPEAWKTLNTNFVVGDTITILGSALGGANGVNDVKIEIKEIITVGSTGTITIKEEITRQPAVIINKNVGEIETANISGNGKFIDRKGSIVATSETGTPLDTTGIAMPSLSVQLTADLSRSLNVITAEQDTAQKLVSEKKLALVSRTRKLISQLGQEQEKKFRAMNMSMILYDEVPNYTQSSRDALVGNTYSRTTDCQFKRI